MLIAIAEPQAQQMRAIPGWGDGFKVALERFVGITAREDRIAVSERHGAAVWMTGGELHGNRGAGVPSVARHLLNAERGECVGQCIGEIFHTGLRDGQFVRLTESGHVEGEAGEAPGEDLHERPHHLGRDRARMQHGDRRAAACAQVVHAALAYGDEVTGDFHRGGHPKGQ